MTRKKKKKHLGSTRGSWFGVNPITKKTPTLTERKRKIEKKHKNKEELE